MKARFIFIYLKNSFIDLCEVEESTLGCSSSERKKSSKMERRTNKMRKTHLANAFEKIKTFKATRGG